METPVPVVQRPSEVVTPQIPPEPTGEPFVGLDEQPLVVEPVPVATTETRPTSVQRVVQPATMPVVSPSPAPVTPSSVPVVARTVVPATAVDTRTTPGAPGALPEVTPRPVPALPLPTVARSVAGSVAQPVALLPVAVPRAAEAPGAPDSPSASEPPANESADVPADPTTPTAVELLGERPIRVEDAPISTPLPTAPTPMPTAPAVQRAVTRLDKPDADPGRSPSPPAIPIQRTAASATPLPLKPPALAWPPLPAAAPTPVRPVPAPGLTVQALAADQASGSAAQTVQRVVVEPLSSSTGADLPEPAVAPTPFVPDRLDSTPQGPGGEAPRIAGPAAPVGPSLHVQRSTATISAPPPVPVDSRPPVPESPRAPTYESMPAVIRSMPLQRLFSATTPQAPRPELPTRPSTHVPVHADQFDHPVGDATGGTEVAIRWEQPQATLQRAEESAGEAGGAPAPEPPSAAGAATPLGSAAPTPAKPGGADMDELARRLYAPMSALLRAELWLDRERSGRSMTR